MNALHQARKQAHRDALARCPSCGRPAVLSGNWAGCRNPVCDGGKPSATGAPRPWQGRISDVWIGDWYEETQVSA